MMLHVGGASRNICSLLAVTSSNSLASETKNDYVQNRYKYPLSEDETSGYLEAHVLRSPSKEGFRGAMETHRPSFVYFGGNRRKDNVGPLVLDGQECSSAEVICGLFAESLPVVVYLEIPNGKELAEALHSKGIPYVIYWNSLIPLEASSHLLHSLLVVLRSSVTHAWDAFQFVHASFKLFCQRKTFVFPHAKAEAPIDLGLQLLGSPPTEKDISPIDVNDSEDQESAPSVTIHDDDVKSKLLICGSPCSWNAESYEWLEHGVNALLTSEMRGSKLLGRFSTLQPMLLPEMVSRDVVMMRCDMSTCSCAHISLLLSGNAQICFDDRIMESHIKKSIVGIACGAQVFEVLISAPSWAYQVLRQLALDASYHSLVALGVASIQGLAVASFNSDNAENLDFLSYVERVDDFLHDPLGNPPIWLKPPAPSRKLAEKCPAISPEHSIKESGRCNRFTDWDDSRSILSRPRLKVAALRPVPRIRQQKMQFVSLTSGRDGSDNGQFQEANVAPPPKPRVIKASTYRRSSVKSLQAKQVISLNPLPLKKHGCDRGPIQECSEGEFLSDLMHFLNVRGHTRLVPQGGVAEFPEAVLNAKRLDLYNLYKEVVSRGGFHVGNGINWKGQVFSKMSNYTSTHRMTGVGNTLKRHYETYLLEYELAHDDVDGECCLLCHSGAPGDWVNCGTCGEWAHFGCDRRQGLGAFKDYAKTDGLEYTCPNCSVTNPKKRVHMAISNGFT
ncbi:hypothetical protein MLD38_004786 [Melastoma candidum]|uniref:Uncharacterized protein n=1 Tax=Melastoma candidum TaxID=119954 RepID=A0ACB9S6X7_9MYRT|nr:hypothetical protein MLD38_004786 [Melastoma candidum]